MTDYKNLEIASNNDIIDENIVEKPSSIIKVLNVNYNKYYQNRNCKFQKEMLELKPYIKLRLLEASENGRSYYIYSHISEKPIMANVFEIMVKEPEFVGIKYQNCISSHRFSWNPEKKMNNLSNDCIIL